MNFKKIELNKMKKLQNLNGKFSLFLAVISVICIISTSILHYNQIIGVISGVLVNRITIVFIISLICALVVQIKLYLNHYNETTVGLYLISVIALIIYSKLSNNTDIITYTALGEIWYYLMNISLYLWLIWYILNFFILSGIEPNESY